MKKFRKLVPALCMLLVSAVLMGTSTYAWFSMNKTVTATGMTITAQSDSTFLVIVEGSSFDPATATETVITSTASETHLYPVMPADTLTSDNVTTPASWKYSYSNDPDSSTSNGTYTPCTTLDNYVASETFTIGLNNKSGVDTSAKNISLASVELPANTGISCVVVCDSVIGTYTANSSVKLDLGVKANKSGTTVTVYYFINGEDTNVKTNNINSLTGAVTLLFTVE